MHLLPRIEHKPTPANTRSSSQAPSSRAPISQHSLRTAQSPQGQGPGTKSSPTLQWRALSAAQLAKSARGMEPCRPCRSQYPLRSPTCSRDRPRGASHQEHATVNKAVRNSKWKVRHLFRHLCATDSPMISLFQFHTTSSTAFDAFPISSNPARGMTFNNKGCMAFSNCRAQCTRPQRCREGMVLVATI